MIKKLLTVTALLISLSSYTQTTSCVGGDTLCITLLPDTTICSGTKLELLANATSSVAGTTITYQWTDITNNNPLANKDSLNQVFSKTSVTVLDIEIHAQYINGDTFNVYDTFKLTINPLPVISIKKPYLTEVCFTESIYLNAFNTTPFGGTWQHWGDTSAVNNHYFLPGKVGSKTESSVYDLTYISINAYGCTDSAQTKIKILRLPPVKATAPDPICNSSGPFKLQPYVIQPLSPHLGMQHWSSLTQPDAVSEHNGEYYFTPYQGLKGANNPNKLAYTFTDLTTGCYDTDTMHLIVKTATPIVFGNPGIHCASGPELKLDSLYNISPIGGKWACVNCNWGNPINNDSTHIDPAFRLTGYTYQLQYRVNINGCFSVDAVNFKTTKAPNLSVSADDYDICENENTVNLHASPFGGSWSGKGIVDSTFYVNQGNKGNTNTLTYSYYDATLNCSNYADVKIMVWQKPSFSLIMDNSQVCDNDSAFIFAQYSKTITDINWSGVGNGNSTIYGDTLVYHPHILDTLTPVTIYATASNPSCPDSTKSISFSVINCSKVSVQKTEQVLVTIYPNPVYNQVILQKPTTKAFTVSLLSAKGRKIKEYNWEATAHQLTIERNNLPTGIYYIILTDDAGQQWQQKLIFN